MPRIREESKFLSRFERATSFPFSAQLVSILPSFVLFFLFSFSFSIDSVAFMLLLLCAYAHPWHGDLWNLLTFISTVPSKILDRLQIFCLQFWKQCKTRENPGWIIAWSTQNCLENSLGSSDFNTDISYSRYLCTWRSMRSMRSFLLKESDRIAWRKMCAWSPIMTLAISDFLSDFLSDYFCDMLSIFK